MVKHTSIDLDDHLDAFVDAQISQGPYQSATEVVAAALRLLEDDAKRADQLQAALIKGEESGFIDDFNFDEFIAAKRRK